MSIIVSCDLSVRSSGIVALAPVDDEWAKLVDFRTIDNEAEGEELLIENFRNVLDFISTLPGDVSAFVVEGLAFSKFKGKNADLLVGNHWFIRASLNFTFGTPNFVYPATQWRKEFISAARQREVKASGETDPLKKEAFRILPTWIQREFNEYAKMKKPPTLVYDLADAYLMGLYFIRNKPDGFVL